MILPTLGFFALFMMGSSAEEYPSPHVVLVGPTGSGKSSLANALLGCDPRGDNDCMFGVCGGLDSCTKNTTIGSGQWLGVAESFTIVDTPGFGDSDGSDNKLIQEMMDILDNELGSANVIVLVIDGATPRFSSGLYDMLRQMSSIFGETWWDFMMVGVSKWPYDQASIDKRQNDCNDFGDPSDFCKNEAWFIRELSQQLKEKFDIRRNLTFAFMDSYSQSGQTNQNDEVQQSHWTEETNKLWSEATSRNETFDFKTIDDVLEENALCKEENNRLNDIIAEDIKQLKENVSTLGARGSWCGYQDKWEKTNSTITYENIFYSDSNMKTDTPLNRYTGIFTVPVSGAWRLSYSLLSDVKGNDENYCSLYKKGQELYETRHWTYSTSGQHYSTGGRVVTVEASAGDEIELRADRVDLVFWRILFCAEFIPKI